MTTRADTVDARTVDDRARAARVLANHGRSFHWASVFLTEQHARDAAALYAFCRHADDLVDERPPSEGLAAIKSLRARLARATDTSRSASAAPEAAFVELMQRRLIEPATVDLLLATLQRDAGPVRLRDRDELLRYAFGVASTVGLMMCDVLGCTDQRARAFAIDLGIAMQLTNVARDVLEDAARNRIYLPLPGHVRPEAILAGSGSARDQARTAVEDALQLAARYYRSADRGLRYLPWRARCAILAASRIYEAIGGVIRSRGGSYWQQRCHVGTVGKLWHTGRAVLSLVFVPRYWRSFGGVAHDPSLHAALHDLPGAGSP